MKIGLLGSTLQNRKSANERKLCAFLSGGAILGLAFAFVILRTLSQTAPSTAGATEADREQALQSFTNAIAINLARQEDPELMKLDASAGVSIFNPALACQERRKDPAVAQADDLAAYSILNPRVVLAQLQKDPAFRKMQEEAFGGPVPLVTP